MPLLIGLSRNNWQPDPLVQSLIVLVNDLKGSVLFFYKFVFYTFVFYMFVFYNSKFISSFFIRFTFYTFVFYTFVFYTVRFLYGSLFIIPNF